MKHMADEFKKDITRIINKHGIDSALGVADIVLGEQVCWYLESLSVAISEHDPCERDTGVLLPLALDTE